MIVNKGNYIPATVAAAITGHSLAWLKNRADEGLLPVYNHGTVRRPIYYYKRSEVETFMESLRVNC